MGEVPREKRTEMGMHVDDRDGIVDSKAVIMALKKILTFKWSLMLLKRLNTTRKVKLKICRSED